MIKRVFLLILCLGLVFGFSKGTFLSYAQTDSAVDDAIRLLDYLHIIPNMETQELSTPVTRAEFAVYLSNMIGFEESNPSNVRYFNDVPMNGWAQPAINHLVELGVITGDENGLFRPDDVIGDQEAMKMIVTLLGYAPYAQAHGGYPFGYISTAAQLDIWSSTIDDTLILEEAILLTANALVTGIYEVGMISDSGSLYQTSADKTLLSVYHNLYEGEGVLQTFYGGTLTYGETVRENRIVVDGIQYDCDTDVSGYLGQKIQFFYEMPENNGISNVVVAYSSDADNNVLVITIENFISFDGGRVRYCNENGKQTYARLDTNCAVVKNGSPVIDGVNAAFDMEHGEYKLIDADNSGSYETVILSEYEVAKVQSVDQNEQTIYVETIDGKTRSYDISSVDVFQILTDDGELPLSELTGGYVLNVYESENILQCYATNTRVTGTIESISLGNAAVTVMIDGIEHLAYQESYENGKAVFAPGNSVDFLTDRYGRLAFTNTSLAGNSVFGYLINATTVDENLLKKAKLKLLNAEGEIVTLDCAERVTVDGARVDCENVVPLLLRAGSGSINQVICYEQNIQGHITAIDTQYQNERYESDFTLKKVYVDDGGIWVAANSRFNRAGTHTIGNIRFVVPAKDEIADAEDYQFYVETSNMAQGTRHDALELYSVNPNDFFDTVAVIYQGGKKQLDTRATMFLVKDIIQRLSNDGEVLDCVQGLSNEAVEYCVDPNYEETWTGLGIGCGDVIRVATNSKGYIVNVDIIYQHTAGDKTPRKSNIVSGVESLEDYSMGRALKKQNNTVAWDRFEAWGTGTPEYFDIYRMRADIPINVYDEKARDKKVYVGTINDILDAETVGYDLASDIIFQTSQGNPKCLIVFKYGWNRE